MEIIHAKQQLDTCFKKESSFSSLISPKYYKQNGYNMFVVKHLNFKVGLLVIRRENSIKTQHVDTLQT